MTGDDMDKSLRFITCERNDDACREEALRLQDWNEFLLPLCGKDRETQASRCMDCGTPFCHDGCPLGNLIPEFNEYLGQGRWERALERLQKTNNFPEFTGRVCPSLCEGSCTLGLLGPMVTVRSNELAIIEDAFARGLVKPCLPAVRTGRKVAVAGSGPAGLACAQELNKAGHLVTIYEKQSHPGGLLMYGIPSMKLEKEIIKRRISLMEQEGITFVTDTCVGKDLTKDELLESFDALVLACGSPVPRDLDVPGRAGEGVHFALDYLSGCIHGQGTITAKGKNVVIIGGGDTGNDCVASALRQGAKSIRQLEILPEPPEARGLDNPWPQFPRIKKTDYGQREHLVVFGRDPREYCIATKAFNRNDQGVLLSVDVAEVEWKKDRQSRFQPVELSGSGKTYPADLVLLAMGFTGPDPDLVKEFGLNLPMDPGSYRTGNEKVFVSGDMRRGQSLVVWAIREGREAARACNATLMGG
ncbi:MAG: glutamate synthase subunit beta [Clostridia bacterium]